ncbi:DUF4926 domain-containing protein [Paenibacillus sp. LHD-38]|uniref:DUF4926 domain-containing protein n=1 Tax=Paenibacillus sp. LHD-38 TaxID=3072143 RepID=UPI0035BE5F3B
MLTVRFKLFEVVKSLKNYPEEGVYIGDTATNVEVYSLPTEGYELEFVNQDGTTKAFFLSDLMTGGFLGFCWMF